MTPEVTRPRLTRARVGRGLLIAVVVLVLVLAGLLAVSWLLSGTTRASDTLEGVTAVDVRVDRGDVELVGSARTDVEVVIVEERAPLHRPEVTVRRDGDRLVIEADCRRRLGPLSIGGCRTDLLLSLPDTVQAVVQTRSGTLASTSMQAGTRLTTDRGPVRVEAQAGDLQVAALRGSVEVRDLAAPTADLRAPRGRVDVTVAAPGTLLSVRTGGGDIGLTVPAGGYALTAEMGGGRIELAEGVANDPASVSAWTVRTDGGDLTVRVVGATG